ncbi:MAG: hypothetical protein HKN18_02830 [Silicimonas sp.]|nr:hypothetical protein [Silicimonas sp.]
MKSRSLPALLTALALSFSVYLIPIYNLHAGWQLLGVVLFSGTGASPLSVAWIAAALLIQGLAFVFLFWVIRRFRWSRLAALVAAAPVFVIVANYGLLYAIPLFVLVENDASPEFGKLELVCSVDNAAIAQVRAGSDLGLVRAGEVRLIDTHQMTLSILNMPGCMVTSQGAPDLGLTVDAVAPGGHLLHRSKNGELRYFNLETGASRPLDAPNGASNWSPILSDDGVVLAWLERVRLQGSPHSHRIRTRNLSDGTEQTINLDFTARDQLELIGASLVDGPFTIAKFRNEFFRVDRNGDIVRGPISPEHLYDARWGFQWLENGWVGWDGYRSEGRYYIAWATPAGRKAFPIPRGRGLDSVSIARDGSVIAAAYSSNISIGNVEGAIVLVRTSDGEEIFRQKLPRFSRTNLAFIGDRHLAISRTESNQALVDVYRIPHSGE